MTLSVESNPPEDLALVDFSAVDFIVPAAGSGQRMGANVSKQYLHLADKPILQHTLEKLLELAPRKLVLVVAEGDRSWRSITTTRHCLVVTGGSTRAASVLNGLNALRRMRHGTDDGEKSGDWVLVHDSVRPCVRLDNIRRLFKAVMTTEAGGLLALPVIDTLKKVDGEDVSTQPRQVYWLAQTPQIFRFALLHQAMTQAKVNSVNISDEASAIELLGFNPVLVEGNRENIKITTREDLPLAEFYLRRQAG